MSPPQPRLFHVSEQSGIAHFSPRVPANTATGLRAPVVWAVDEDHLAHYLLPRDCPRVGFRAQCGTSQADRRRFIGPAGAGRVVAIEARWFEAERLLATGAELRVVPDLVALAQAVAASTLAFSCIRMRNAGSGHNPG